MIQYAIVFLLFVFAWVKGGEPEKAVATTFIAMMLADEGYHFSTGLGTLLTSTDTAHALIDIAAAVSLISVALLANRNYTLWIGGLQIVATLAHFARAVAQDISPIAYSALYIGPSYFQIIILGFGIWLHQRRVKRFGNYRSWRSFWPRLPGDPRRG